MRQVGSRVVLLATLTLGVAGCGDDDFEVPVRDGSVTIVDAGPDAAPKNMAGNYMLAVTNGANGCGYANWMENAMSSGVPLTVVQAGSAVTAEITGITGGLVMLATGSRTFTGTVDAAGAFSLVLIGTRAEMQNACTYTRKVFATGTVVGDAIQGTLDYTTATNGSPDCGTLENCHTIQRFSGSRPPM
ncbi:MAG: hypothetical protein IT370_17580 [Deltaproteobacteria bacterium]|nr:hypothetical protein [Deltaproteobacteria bacterium]